MNKDKFGIEDIKRLLTSAKPRFMRICFRVNLTLNSNFSHRRRLYFNRRCFAGKKMKNTLRP